MSASRGLPRRSRLSALNIGLAFTMIAMVAGVGLFQKQRIATNVRSGELISVEFAESPRLRAFNSEAKIAGVGIGVVISVRQQDSGSSEVVLKVDKSALEAMGTAPSARVRPTTLLGGKYYVDIKPGGLSGAFEGTIPLARTQLPVELDSIAAALPADARDGIRSGVSDLDNLFDAKGSAAVRDLVKNAPGTLDPMAGVLRGVRGTRPKNDLPDLVDGLESTARVLSRKQDQLDGIVADLERTSAILADRRNDITTATAGMPETLDNVDGLLKKLQSSLEKLEKTAGPTRPSVKKLDKLLKDGDPVLVRARPIVRNLRAVVADARPIVEDLVPSSRNLTGTLDDLQGPVLDRVNGPIMKTVLSPWHGSGDYAGGGADRPFYKELGYMASNLAQAAMVDENGAMLNYMLGFGPGALAGLPISLEQLFTQLSTQAGAR